MLKTWISRFIITFMSLSVFLPQSARQASSKIPSPRPNVLLIVSDDQRYDTMNFMPRTEERIFNQGVNFSRAYVTTPTCTPSRSSILTGKYAERHGAVNNDTMLKQRTFVHDLHDSGYNTGLVGKFMNPWNGSPRPEYNFMAAYSNEIKPYPYTNPTMLVNNVRTIPQGYSTTILRDYALQFLDDAATRPEPFALIYTPYAPHIPSEPAPGDENLYPNLPPHRPPNFNIPDVSNKPRWLQAQPSLSASQISSNDALRRKQLQTLNSLDQSVDQLLDRLEEPGQTR